MRQFGDAGRLATAVIVIPAALVTLLALHSLAQQPSTQPAAPVVLVLKDGTRVQGKVVSAGESEIVLQVGKEQKTLPVDQVAPLSVYLARRNVMDLARADTHLELGKYLLKEGLSAQAKKELDEAARLDPGLSAEVKTLLASAPGSAPPPPPVKTPASKPAPAPEEVAPKYQPVTTQQAQANHKLAADWAGQARAFVPTMHAVESPHFEIYSAWDAGNDKPLVEICEKMYEAMCRQFDIPPKDNIWAGKCALYVFWESAHYKRFCVDVVKGGNVDAAGFCGWRGNGLVYIVMGPARTKAWFYEMLVHEATHGFISRYLSDHDIPNWVNEGLAEYMAASLLPGTNAKGRCNGATREAIREKKEKEVRDVLDRVGLEDFDYGIAHSLVAFLIARDRAAFVKFITVLKEGKSEQEALKQAFNFTRDDLLREWSKAAAKTVG